MSEVKNRETNKGTDSIGWNDNTRMTLKIGEEIYKGINAEEARKKIRESANKDYRVIEYDHSSACLDVTIDGEEYTGLTAQEVAKRFGTNYDIIENLRKMFRDDQIEETIKQEQSVKDEIIDIFMKTLEENNIFEGKLTKEEIRKRLEENIDAAYITNKGYRENIAGFWDTDRRDIYVLSKNDLAPEQLKKAVLNRDIKQLKNIDRLGTICHEVLHALSTRTFLSERLNNKRLCGDAGFSGNHRGMAINEGMTEILAEKMVPSSHKVYEKEVNTTKFLMAIFGEDKMISAYLNADGPSLLKMAEEKQASTEFIKLMALSDSRVNLHLDEVDTTEIDTKIDEAMVELIYVTGLDISKFVEYDIEIPSGLNYDVLEKSIQEYIANGGDIEKFREYTNNSIQISDNNIENIDISKCIEYGISIPYEVSNEVIEKEIQEYIKNGGDIKVFREYNKKNDLTDFLYQKMDNIYDVINEQNNGEIKIEEYIKYGFINHMEDKISLTEYLGKKGNALKTYSENIKGILEATDEIEGENSIYTVALLLKTAIEQEHEQNDTELCEFKNSIISEIMNPEKGRFINTAKNKDGEFKYSSKDMLSRIDSFEYYETDIGKFVVDSKNGEIIALNSNGELDKSEDNSIGKNDENKATSIIKYKGENEQDKLFKAEKNQEGKYILKGYIQDENGQYVETDVGLGKNFCDDTTEIDKQLVAATTDVRTGEINEMSNKIKEDINKDKQEEKSTIEKEDKQDEGR